jgi:hypothetical protein
MIERQAVRDPGATVMPYDREALVAEGGHQLRELGGHLPLRVPLPARAAGRRAGGAVPAQIGYHHAMSAGELRGDQPPAEVGLRKAMQQQDGWTGAARGGEVARLPDVTALVLESRQRHALMMDATRNDRAGP